MSWLLFALCLLVLPNSGICQPKPILRALKPKTIAVAPSRSPLAARKPSAADQRATIFSVEGKAPNTDFVLPQVRLANLTAARRINQWLVAHFNSINGDTLPSTARQAVRAAEVHFSENNGRGFRGYEFEALYNAHGVLSLALSITELGEHELISGSHATFDLRTGRQIALADLIADTAALQRNWQRQVTAITRESVESATTYLGQDSASLVY